MVFISVILWWNSFLKSTFAVKWDFLFLPEQIYRHNIHCDQKRNINEVATDTYVTKWFKHTQKRTTTITWNEIRLKNREWIEICQTKPNEMSNFYFIHTQHEVNNPVHPKTDRLICNIVSWRCRCFRLKKSTEMNEMKKIFNHKPHQHKANWNTHSNACFFSFSS